MAGALSVGAVIVTYNRSRMLRELLAALKAQSRPVDEIIVVDNASQDGTDAMIRKSFPEATCLRLPENIGPAGGFAAGMQTAYEHGHDWVWVFNDDSFPELNALERCLKTVDSLDTHQGIGILFPSDGIQYGAFWRGRPVPAPRPIQRNSGPHEVDLVTFNGALVARRAMEHVGTPHSDYFMMFEEWEYCIRLRKAGFMIVVLPEVLIHNLAAGSSSTSSPPWRGYYQTRNHLAMVLERRSIEECFWWLVRQIKFVIGTILYLDRKWERIRLRALGAWDGLRGRMGRTIDPAEYT